jgi:hypothetical protein
MYSKTPITEHPPSEFCWFWGHQICYFLVNQSRKKECRLNKLELITEK